MIYFKHSTTGEVFAYETQQERATFGAAELIPMSEAEVSVHLAVPAPSAPQSVTRFQARAALHLAGLLTTVESLMTDPQTDMLARLAWQDAQEFRRQSPTVLSMAATLGLTDAQLDALFTTAAGIEA